jgi:iron(III) transport system ATP-binding protein
MGSHQYYQALIGGIEVQITDYNPVGRKTYAAGEDAWIDFDPEGVYIL